MRFARNVILYSIPESPDTLEDNLVEMLNEAYWDTILKHRLNALKLRAASKDARITGDELTNQCK